MSFVTAAAGCLDRLRVRLAIPPGRLARDRGARVRGRLRPRPRPARTGRRARAPGPSFRDAEAMFAARRSISSRSARGPTRTARSWRWPRGTVSHVLCQKPAALDRADLLAMIDACDAAGVRLMIHENWRFRPGTAPSAPRSTRGPIGRPIRLRIATATPGAPARRVRRPALFRDDAPADPAWRWAATWSTRPVTSSARSSRSRRRVGRFGAGHPGEDVATLSLDFRSRARSACST